MAFTAWLGELMPDGELKISGKSSGKYRIYIARKATRRENYKIPVASIRYQ